MTSPSIIVNLLSGPIGSCGFRTGVWHYTVDGEPGTIYASIPHECTLDEQTEMLIQRIERRLDKQMEITPPKRTSGQITWYEDQGSGRGYLILRCDDGGHEEVQWDTPITATTDSHEIVGLFDGYDFASVNHDDECIHVVIRH